LIRIEFLDLVDGKVEGFFDKTVADLTERRGTLEAY